MGKGKPNIVVDFDGVLNTYTGWQGPDELFEPADGSRGFLETLSNFYSVYILSTRPSEKIRQWLIDNQLSKFVYDCVDEKPPAVAYIDDRGIQFNGNFDEVIETLKNGFKPHWAVKKESTNAA